MLILSHLLYSDPGLKELTYIYELRSDGDSFFFHSCSLLHYLVTKVNINNESGWDIDMLKLVSALGDMDTFSPKFDVESIPLLLPPSYCLTPEEVKMVISTKFCSFLIRYGGSW